MKAGDLVRFHTPMADEKAGEVYRVVEDRDTRVIIQSTEHEDWPIIPVMTAQKADLELV